MKTPKEKNRRSTEGSSSRMPEGSVFFEKIVPVLLIGMSIVAIGLILFAAGVLLGLVNF